jgi:membrane protease YdiL (CAAX protease family)
LPASVPNPVATWFIATLFLAAACAIYARVIHHLLRQGGKVRSGALDLPELLMSVVFAGFFIMMMIPAIQRQSRGDSAVKIDIVLPSSLIFVVFTVGILCFLHFRRRLRIVEVFGLNQAPPLAVLGWAAGLILASFPLTGAANAFTLLVLKSKVEPQPLVELFSRVAREGDHLAVAKILFAGVIIAPCCEEFLFRGFFYGVWKRYLGPLGAGFLACLFFAAFHTSLTAFGGLFVLAACLNLAYERTGSLFVPIGMHAIFNFISLLSLYMLARFGPGS